MEPTPIGAFPWITAGAMDFSRGCPRLKLGLGRRLEQRRRAGPKAEKGRPPDHIRRACEETDRSRRPGDALCPGGAVPRRAHGTTGRSARTCVSHPWSSAATPRTTSRKRC